MWKKLTYFLFAVVPEKVLETVETVIRVAKEGKTTLFKASDVLELTTDAYQYARRACIDDFELERESGAVLRNYDDVFKRMIQNRIETKVDDAEEDLRDCRDLLSGYSLLICTPRQEFSD